MVLDSVSTSFCDGRLITTSGRSGLEGLYRSRISSLGASRSEYAAFASIDFPIPGTPQSKTCLCCFTAERTRETACSCPIILWNGSDEVSTCAVVSNPSKIDVTLKSLTSAPYVEFKGRRDNCEYYSSARKKRIVKLLGASLLTLLA